GPHPAILLLHGSGSSHQNYNKSYFKFHANAFLEAGFAVMIYSKRSSKDVDYSLFTYEDLLEDAQAAISFLKNRHDIDQQNIGVMGLSESGWFTPQLVDHNPDIKFLINRVSSPLNVQETIYHEIQSDALSEGFTKEDVEQIILPMHKRLCLFYIDVHEGTTQANGTERKAINKKLEQLNSDERFGKWFTFSKLDAYDSIKYVSLAKRYSYDPLPFFNKIKLPMLYVMAGRDKNIPTAIVVEALTKAKQEGKDITIKVYPESSHYLYKYGLEDGPFEGWMYHDDYLEVLTTWAKDQVEKID
ncbi:MAG: alpha/beta hydrolase, partial [Saprospiraceae bacterium]|nr:alpha/beta hydrolase [Saprospiraceae bacterium]